MATEAAFKEIPEIFKMCVIWEEFVDSHVINHLPGRARGRAGGSNRKSRSVSPTFWRLNLRLLTFRSASLGYTPMVVSDVLTVLDEHLAMSGRSALLREARVADLVYK